MTTRNTAYQEALQANIQVHASLANAGEYQKSPHFRPENIAKVRSIIKRVTQDLPATQRKKALDFGCGTGFMIDLIKDLFEHIHGLDITQDMMKHVDTSSGNITLHESTAESTPFADNSFDMATAYSFMDHLLDYTVFLREAFRVLKPGGIFFSDLNPNKAFILAMEQAESSPIAVTSSLVLREIKGALHNGNYYQENFGLDPDTLDKAEPTKSQDKGFLASEVYQTAQSIGFSRVDIEYEWYLGQGKIMHDISPAEAERFDAHLQSIIPASAPLYKYLRFIFIK